MATKRSFQPPPVSASDAQSATPIPGGGFRIPRFPKPTPLKAVDDGLRGDAAAATPVLDSTPPEAAGLAPAPVDTTVSPVPFPASAEAAAVAAGDTSAMVPMAAAQGDPADLHLPLSSLKAHPWNARVHRQASRIRDLGMDLSTNGQLAPILVAPDPEQPGTWFVVDGETRWKSSAKLNWPTIWARQIKVDPNEPKEFYATSFERTAATDPISHVDQGIRWAALVDAGHASYDWLVERLGKSKSTISMMLSYSKFPPKVVEYMAEHSDSFPYSIAAELARSVGDVGAFPEEDLLSLATKIVEENVSRRGIDALVKHYSRDATEKRERKSAQVNVPIKAGTVQFGALRSYSNGGVELKLQPTAALDEANRHGLMQILEATVAALNSGALDLRKDVLERIAAIEPPPKPVE